MTPKSLLSTPESNPSAVRKKRLSFLDPQNTQRLIVPSSSTAALGVPQGGMDRITTIVRPEIQQAVKNLHIADIQDGAGFIVTATCGAHERQARPDPKPWHHLDPRRNRADQLYELNTLAVQVAITAREELGDPLIAIFGSVITSGDCYNGQAQLRGCIEKLESRYRDDHRSQIEAFAVAGQSVDAVLFEAGGVSSVELNALCELCCEFSLPLLISLAVDDAGRTLDPIYPQSFRWIAEEAKYIMGNDFLGLGLNCNSRSATKAALEKDTHDDIRLVYPNRSNANAEQRRKQQFGDLATHVEEISFLGDVLTGREHLCAVGCCCRNQRSAELIKDFRTQFSRL